MRNLFFIFALLSVSLSLTSETLEVSGCCDCFKNYEVLIDLSGGFGIEGNSDFFPMPVGAEDLITAHRLYIKLSNQFLTRMDLVHSERIWAVPARFAKTILFDFPVANLLMVVQHEYFGHGARLRSLDIPAKYRIEPPFPFGSGGGATFFPSAEFSALPLQQQQGITIGGVESTEVLARRLVRKSVLCREWDYREGLLYLLTFHDLTDYIFSIHDLDEGGLGHDIKSYVRKIDQLYSKDALSYRKLRNMAYLNYLDPMTFVSFHSLFKYWWEGEKTVCIPMFRLGDVHFLPGFRLTLAPYGPEYGLYTYFSVCDTIATAYVRYGETARQRSIALGFEADQIWKIGHWDVGIRLDIWEQPNINKNHLPISTQFGGLIGGRFSWKFSDFWSFVAEIGGKTRGFVVGEPLNGNLYLRTGIALHRF